MAIASIGSLNKLMLALCSVSIIMSTAALEPCQLGLDSTLNAWTEMEAFLTSATVAALVLSSDKPVLAKIQLLSLTCTLPLFSSIHIYF